MKKNNKGVILIIVLGFSLALTFITLFFNYKINKYVDSLSILYESLQMDRISEVGFEIAKEIIEKDRNNYDWLEEKWNKERSFKIENYDLIIIIKDENSKINLNKVIGEKGQSNQLLLDILKNLFIICEYPSSLLDCLLDWIDEDNLERPFGAEYFYYSKIGLKKLPPNKNISNLRELYLIKDYNEKILTGDKEKNKKGLLDFITIYSDDKININTCEKEIMNAMGFTNEEVDSILSEREKKPLNETFLIKINREVFLKNKSLIKYVSNYFYVSINVKNEKGYEKIYKGIFEKNKDVRLIKKGIL
ncbi:MAG: general secretion pathway protein GspK [Candidatus Omnitrophica bacterium]|nr:general secretion pathway protein GspK [Candidatus Omnitrophota bacterium]